MNHRRKLLPAATLLACSAFLLAGCGESGGVSAVPVKGERSAGSGSTTPKVAPSASAAPTIPAGPLPAGKKQTAPLDVVE
jgi:hypothetical protein